jgi:hypothetical protein
MARSPFFDEEKRHDIPSSSLEDVFAELKKQWNVEVVWMAVNAKAMSIDHRPKGGFEQAGRPGALDGLSSLPRLDFGERRVLLPPIGGATSNRQSGRLRWRREHFEPV